MMRASGWAVGRQRTDNERKVTYLDFIGTWPARLELTILAFEDVPVRARMTHAANPLD